MESALPRLGRPPKYSDERKAEIIAAIEVEYDGNVSAAARAFGVPQTTVLRWVQPKTRVAKHATHKTGTPMPALPPQELLDQKRQGLTDIFESIIAKYSKFLEDAELSGQKPVQAATVVGILFDKLQIMKGMPTHITQTNVRYMEKGSLQKMARERLQVLEGGKGQSETA